MKNLVNNANIKLLLAQIKLHPNQSMFYSLEYELNYMINLEDYFELEKIILIVKKDIFKYDNKIAKKILKTLFKEVIKLDDIELKSFLIPELISIATMIDDKIYFNDKKLALDFFYDLHYIIKKQLELEIANYQTYDKLIIILKYISSNGEQKMDYLIKDILKIPFFVLNDSFERFISFSYEELKDDILFEEYFKNYLSKINNNPLLDNYHSLIKLIFLTTCNKKFAKEILENLKIHIELPKNILSFVDSIQNDDFFDFSSNHDIIDLLSKDNINNTNKDGNSSLMLFLIELKYKYKLKDYFIEHIKFILKREVDINIKNNKNETALALALEVVSTDYDKYNSVLEESHINIIKMILSKEPKEIMFRYGENFERFSLNRALYAGKEIYELLLPFAKEENFHQIELLSGFRHYFYETLLTIAFKQYNETKDKSAYMSIIESLVEKNAFLLYDEDYQDFRDLIYTESFDKIREEIKYACYKKGLRKIVVQYDADLKAQYLSLQNINDDIYTLRMDRGIDKEEYIKKQDFPQYNNIPPLKQENNSLADELVIDNNLDKLSTILILIGVSGVIYFIDSNIIMTVIFFILIGLGSFWKWANS